MVLGWRRNLLSAESHGYPSSRAFLFGVTVFSDRYRLVWTSGHPARLLSRRASVFVSRGCAVEVFDVFDVFGAFAVGLSFCFLLGHLVSRCLLCWPIPLAVGAGEVSFVGDVCAATSGEMSVGTIVVFVLGLNCWSRWMAGCLLLASTPCV